MAIKRVYVIGSNKIGSKISASILLPYSSNDSVSYQWYKCSIYDGNYEPIIGQVFKDYIIKISDSYLKCIVTLNGFNYESNIVVVDQLSASEIESNRINIKLSNIGRGLSYQNPVSEVSGASNIAYDILRINQSINMILAISLKEVPMLPELGSDLYKRLFNNVTDEELELIRLEVMNILEQQEPRIILIDVEVVYDEVHTVRVIVNYIIRNTNIKSQYIFNQVLDSDEEGIYE